MCSLWIQSDQVPECPLVPATTRLHGGELTIELFGDDMALVPELFHLVVVNAAENGTCRPAPIRRENRFPDDKDRHLVRRLLL